MGGGIVKKTAIDTPVLCFLSAIVCAAIWNSSAFIESLIWVIPVIRYILLYYIIVNMNITKKYSRTLISVICSIFVIQIAIGLTQFIGGERVSHILAPQKDLSWQMGSVEREIYHSYILTPLHGKYLFSTFDHGNLYGGFLVANYVMFIGLFNSISIGKIIKICMLFFGGMVIIFTYSRGTWLALYGGLVTIAIVGNKKWLRYPLLSFLVIVVVAVSLYQVSGEAYVSRDEVSLSGRFFSTFSEPFYGPTRELTRGYLIFDGLHEITQHALLLGLGPGASQDDFYNELDFPYLAALLIGDVGWVNIFGHVGLLGSLAFLWILVRLFRFALKIYRHESDAYVLGMSLGYMGLIVAMTVLFCTASHFFIRSTSYYFWLYSGILCALQDSGNTGVSGTV